MLDIEALTDGSTGERTERLGIFVVRDPVSFLL